MNTKKHLDYFRNINTWEQAKEALRVLDLNKKFHINKCLDKEGHIKKICTNST